MRWVELPGRSSILKLCRHRLAAGDRIGEHRHDFHEIFWVTGGEGEHRVNGESVPVSRGDLVWIRPFDCHGLQGRGRETLELYNLAFDPAVIGELGRRYPEVGRFFAPGDRQIVFGNPDVQDLDDGNVIVIGLELANGDWAYAAYEIVVD